jgi:hypothetical protein
MDAILVAFVIIYDVSLKESRKKVRYNHNQHGNADFFILIRGNIYVGTCCGMDEKSGGDEELLLLLF